MHWPQDSSTKNSRKFSATSSMSRWGPKTMTEPPVGMSSKAIWRANWARGTHVPEAPPICTALASSPPTSLSSSATVMPNGNS